MHALVLTRVGVPGRPLPAVRAARICCHSGHDRRGLHRSARVLVPTSPDCRAPATSSFEHTGGCRVAHGVSRSAGAGCRSAATASEALLLEIYATAESKGLWRLDHSRTVWAVEAGHAVAGLAELRAFLTTRHDQDLPETVQGFLRTTEQRARALKHQGNALLIECADAHIADLLATDRRTAKLCLRAGERNLVVPAESEHAFRNEIHALGYGMPRS